MTSYQDHSNTPARKSRALVARQRVPTRAVVLEPNLARQRSSGQGDDEPPLRTPGERLAEAAGLARAIDLDIVHQAIVPVARIVPATLIGGGKVEEIAGVIVALEAGLVIVDHALTPVQQRNLEKAWNAKVLDRTGLILEIFGRRARTKEGTLQVELAHLNYQRGRLVRSWTHLERQRGGTGFLGGPGETQIEADRRILRDKIRRLERDLEQVRRTRTLHRAKRKRVPLPIVALVGYTNAGKSTLFNRLTGSDVLAEDALFATLDPTLRRIVLPGGTGAIISDTVGFISDLPTHLIAAFRATLEEVAEADLIVHVHDASDAQQSAQAADVRAVLASMGVAAQGAHVIEIFNKIDMLEPELRDGLLARGDGIDRIALSAMTGEGVDQLPAAIEQRIAGDLVTLELVVPADRYQDVAWLYENGMVTARQDRDNGDVVLAVRLTRDRAEAFERRRAAG